MSATTMTMREGFFSAIACKRSTHWLARLRSRRLWASPVVIRARFSRQMPTSQLDLLFDKVKIIEQPLRRGRDAPALIHRQSRAIKSAQHFLVLIQAIEQLGRSAATDGLVLHCDELCVALELLDAKQLRPQWQLFRA